MADKPWKDIRLVQTCSACPEQYDAYLDDGRVGYLRLRYGYFSVRVPDYSGVEVYGVAFPDGLMGMFDDEQRVKYLRKAKKRIWRHLYRLEHGEVVES